MIKLPPTAAKTSQLPPIYTSILNQLMEGRGKRRSLFNKITRSTIKIFIPKVSLFSVSMTSTEDLLRVVKSVWL
jgi:hypothetical protein